MLVVRSREPPALRRSPFLAVRFGKCAAENGKARTKKNPDTFFSSPFIKNCSFLRFFLPLVSCSFGLVAQVSAKNEISALERADNEGGKKKRPRDVVLVSFATTSSYLPTGAQHTC